jgi:hypothetical protein
MTGTVHHIHTHRHHQTPRLTVVATPTPRRRPVSANVALFGAGLTPGFVLAAAVSAQGGAAMVQTALVLAGISAAVTVAAGARARQIARRREQRLRHRERLRPPAPTPVTMRRAA